MRRRRPEFAAAVIDAAHSKSETEGRSTRILTWRLVGPRPKHAIGLQPLWALRLRSPALIRQRNILSLGSPRQRIPRGSGRAAVFPRTSL